MRNRDRHIILLVVLATMAMGLSSCHVEQYIPEGRHVLHTVDIDVRMDDSTAIPDDVDEALRHSRNYLTQRPNAKALGVKWLPVSKWIYGIASPTDKSLWGRYWRRLGEEPVVYEPSRARQSAAQLEQLLETKGCFGSRVRFDTSYVKGRNIGITYHIEARHRRTIDEVRYLTESAEVKQLLGKWVAEAEIKADEPYDQDKLAAERLRIVENLRDAGYYRATPQLVTFVVDTTYDEQSLSIDVNIDSKQLRIYHINNIFVYPDGSAEAGKSDTLIFNYPSARQDVDYQFVYSKPMAVRPQTISRALMLFSGMTYRPRYITSSYNSLLSLHSFKYINIDFSESPSSTDTLPLVDAHVRLMPAVGQRLSLSFELTNASPIGNTDSANNFLLGGNLGLGTSLEYQHKNLFGGAELLRMRGSLLLELPKTSLSDPGDALRGIFSTFETSLDATLDMPVFLLPGSLQFIRSGHRPHTLISAGGSFQYRPYYERALANLSFGYTWKTRLTNVHQLLPIEMTFVRMNNLDPAFAARLNGLNDLRLKYQYSDHFILDARYDFTYTNQQYGMRQNFTALHITAESAGNSLAAISALSGAPADSSGVHSMLGVPFAQYIRLGAEWTHYHYIGRGTLVERVMLGAGLPFANSVSMPYEKSFFGGGPTTLRAWQLRHLGPGSYQGGDGTFERVGDLQLVMNLEGRFPIVGIFEGAVFADMGNVWLLNPSDQYPGGEIKLSSLPEEIAVGWGLGLRLNVSVATLRLDFALPIYDPGYANNMRWRPRHWAVSQVVTSFGINYPF